MFINRSTDFSSCILGASADGIGAGTAIYFAKSSAKLVLTGRNEEGLKETMINCQEASPTKEKVETSRFLHQYNLILMFVWVKIRKKISCNKIK